MSSRAGVGKDPMETALYRLLATGVVGDIPPSQPGENEKQLIQRHFTNTLVSVREDFTVKIGVIPDARQVNSVVSSYFRAYFGLKKFC